MDESRRKPPDEHEVEVYTPYVTRKGRRIWHPRWFSHGEVFRFCVPRDKSWKR